MSEAAAADTRWIRTVGDLLAKLDGLPGDMLVVMSKDAEGNGFSPLSELTEERYIADSTWSGELISDEDGTDPVEGEVPAVVLWPTN